MCLRGKEEWLGKELASPCHTWLQEHETVFPRNRRLESRARLVAGEGDGGEMDFLLQCLEKKEERKRASKYWPQKLVGWSTAKLQ